MQGLQSLRQARIACKLCTWQVGEARVMVSRETVLATLAKLKDELREEYGVSKIGIFGAIVRARMSVWDTVRPDLIACRA
jgi:hypothetical protein